MTIKEAMLLKWQNLLAFGAWGPGFAHRCNNRKCTQYQLENLQIVRGIYHPNNIDNANNFIYFEIVYKNRDKLSQFMK